ncbi:MAG: serine hydrolase [Bacteroidota bacterium]
MNCCRFFFFARLRPAHFILLFLLLSTYHSFGQVEIQGKIVNKQDNQPVAYVNIGIPMTSVGTISNADGSFSIKVPAQYQKNAILFSALGYKSKTIPVESLLGQSNMIYLIEVAISIDEVVVKAKASKVITAKLGNRLQTIGTLHGDSTSAGAAMALLIDAKSPGFPAGLLPPIFPKEAYLRIAINSLDSIKVRVRLYDMDSITGKPGKDLLNESVLITSNKPNGWISVDLSSYNIPIMKMPFFLAFEWLMDKEARQKLLGRVSQFQTKNSSMTKVDSAVVDGVKTAYTTLTGFAEGVWFGTSMDAASLDKYVCYARSNSQGEWKRSEAILTARLFVSDRISKKGQKRKQIPEIVRAESTPCYTREAPCLARQMATTYMNEKDIVGMQLAVAVKGKTVMSEAYGFSDLREQLLTTTQSRFRLGSVSSALTSAALAKLVSKGKLNLDAPIQQYAPAFPVKRYPLTTRQLAGNLAGLRSHETTDTTILASTLTFRNATEAISVFSQDSLMYEPNTHYAHASAGWDLIGAVIEGAAGKNYLSYMKEEIWKPMGMANTYGEVADSLIPNRSQCYVEIGAEAAKQNFSHTFPSSGLLSTAEDLLKYGNQLLQAPRKHFKKAIVKQLFTSQTTKDGNLTQYGMGWHLLKDKKGRLFYYQSSNMAYGSAHLMLYPKSRIVVAFLSNTNAELLFDVQKVGELFQEARKNDHERTKYIDVHRP